MMSAANQSTHITHRASSSRFSGPPSAPRRVFSGERVSFLRSLTNEAAELKERPDWEARDYSNVHDLIMRMGLYAPALSSTDLIGMLSSFDVLVKCFYVRSKASYDFNEQLIQGIIDQKNETLLLLAQRIAEVATDLTGPEVIEVTQMLRKEYLEPWKERLEPALSALEEQTLAVACHFEVNQIIGMFKMFHQTHNLGGECETALWLQAILKAPEMNASQLEDLSEMVETSFTERNLQKSTGVSHHVIGRFTKAIRDRITMLAEGLTAEEISKMLIALNTCNKRFPITLQDKTNTLNALAVRTLALASSSQDFKALKISIGFSKFPEVNIGAISDFLHHNALQIAAEASRMSSFEVSRAIIPLSTFAISEEVLSKATAALALAVCAKEFSFDQNFRFLCGFLRIRVNPEITTPVKKQLAVRLRRQLPDIKNVLSLTNLAQLLNHLSPAELSITDIKIFKEEYVVHLEKKPLSPAEIAAVAEACPSANHQGLGCREMITYLATKSLVMIEDFNSDEVVKLILAFNSGVSNEFIIAAMNAFAKKICEGAWSFNDVEKKKIKQAYVEHGRDNYYFEQLMAKFS